jgi:hypothetical protein
VLNGNSLGLAEKLALFDIFVTILILFIAIFLLNLLKSFKRVNIWKFSVQFKKPGETQMLNIFQYDIKEENSSHDTDLPVKRE